MSVPLERAVDASTEILPSTVFFYAYLYKQYYQYNSLSFTFFIGKVYMMLLLRKEVTQKKIRSLQFLEWKNQAETGQTDLTLLK